LGIGDWGLGFLGVWPKPKTHKTTNQTTKQQHPKKKFFFKINFFF